MTLLSKQHWHNPTCKERKQKYQLQQISKNKYSDQINVLMRACTELLFFYLRQLYFLLPLLSYLLTRFAFFPVRHIYFYKKAIVMNQYIFIDETGSPQFYGKRKRPLWTDPNFVPIICLGMISTDDRVRLRNIILDFKQSILDDILFNSIFSIRKPGWFLHASNDHSDINLKTVELLRKLEGFRFHAVIGRKIPDIFIRKHNGNSTEFYFDLIHKLLALHPVTEGTKYNLFLSQRQSSTVQRFTDAFEKVLKAENKDGKISYHCTVVLSRDFPELSIVDYLLWALQRYILQGESRYFDAMEHHYEQILDIYENDGQGRLYTPGDRFELEKASPFILEKK